MFQEDAGDWSMWDIAVDRISAGIREVVVLIALRPIHHFVRVAILQDNCAAESIEKLAERVDVHSDIAHDNVNCVVVVGDFPCASVVGYGSCSV